MNYPNHISEVLQSSSLLKTLTTMSKNIFNLKLEYFFRDQLVIGLNEVLGEKFKVIPEYPRDKGKRVDLSICRQIEEKLDKQFRLDKMIELKFQFSGDFHCFKAFEDKTKGYENVFVQEMFTKKISDLDQEGPDYFVLIVADWENEVANRASQDLKFDPPVNGLNHFQNNIKKQEKFGCWNENLIKLFSKYDMNVSQGVIEVNGYVPTDYHYYIVEQRNHSV